MKIYEKPHLDFRPCPPPPPMPSNGVVRASNAVIDDINVSNHTHFVTISYDEGQGSCRVRKTVKLVVSRNTLIFDERNRPISARDLQIGMIVDARFSSAMTFSIPPQSQAFQINIVRRPPRNMVSEGRIVQIDSRNQYIVTMNNNNVSSMIRFNITPDTTILDLFGRRTSINNLIPGLRVRVEHANFMTASIPPQTTAFVIQVIR